MSCEYCIEDKDGYVRGLDKQAHYYIYNGELKIKGKCKPIKINYCPMCGRKLKT